ncbi:neprilysin-2-like [Babylonia areolata]|uniref:neprilysin-2-like n=1 Tax=Babylonia areolata TaxID=304850 RepID=UPI003FD5F151
MRIYNTTTDRMPSASGPSGNEPPAPQSWVKEDYLSNLPVRNGHLREAITRDRQDPQEQVELLSTSQSSASFATTATAMGDSRQPPSIGGSKTDLCPDNITFAEGGLWQRRTKLEKCLIALVILFFIAAVVFLTVFLVFRFEKDDTGNICTTLECLQTAAYISNSIDPSANPCDDFYQFACGKWIERNPLTPVLPSINNFVVIQKDLQESMRG